MDDGTESEVRRGWRYVKVVETTRRIVADHLGVDPELVTTEAHFYEHLGGDSLDIVELVMEAEAEFLITVEDALTEKMMNFGQLVDVVWLLLKDPVPGVTPQAAEQDTATDTERRAKNLELRWGIVLGEGLTTDAALLIAVRQKLLPVIAQRLVQDLQVPPERVRIELLNEPAA